MWEGEVGLFLICFVSFASLVYFKFEVRFARLVLLCLDGKVFTSVFIWLLFAFFSRRKRGCVGLCCSCACFLSVFKFVSVLICVLCAFCFF